MAVFGHCSREHGYFYGALKILKIEHRHRVTAASELALQIRDDPAERDKRIPAIFVGRLTTRISNSAVGSPPQRSIDAIKGMT